MAVSIHLLDFYCALFERSCEAVNALAAALHSFYTQRGFDVLDISVSSSLVILYLNQLSFRVLASKNLSDEALDMPFSGTIPYKS